MILNKLSFRYSGQKKNTIEDISMTIEQGEFVLLCGPSGCGKTTITRVMNGLCPEFYEGDVQGEYLLNDVDMLKLKIKEKSQMIGSVFQDPETQFFATEGYDEIVLGAEQKGIHSKIILEQLEAMNQLLDVTHLYDKKLLQMSSGEKQKIAIASVSLLMPKVLVLDEPSANLDEEAIQELGKILKVLKDHGMTIVLSEHRFHYVKLLIDKVFYINEGRIKEMYHGHEFITLNDRMLNDLGLRSMRVRQIDEHLLTSCNTNGHLTIAELGFRYQKTGIFNSLNLDFSQGEITVITGHNGAGKTTLLRIIGGALSESQGEILLDGKAFKKKDRLRKTFLLEQNGNNQLYSNKVFKEFLMEDLNTDLTAVDELLETLDLMHKKNDHPLTLSGGQKQRLLIGISMLSERDILLLDEPTSGLDARNMKKIADVLKSYVQLGKSIVVITHDIEFINLTADRVFKL